MKKCSIIIPSYNEAENLNNCLKSLQNISFPREEREVVVVDNNSTDNTAEVVSHFSDITYLNEERQGASFARNKGIKKAQGNILVFLDADTTVTEKWLSFLIEPFEDKNIGAVGGAIYPSNEKNIFSQYLSVSLFMKYPCHGKKRKVKGYPSCNLAGRKKLLFGGFDTSLFSTYFEDKDVCYQILKNGYEIVYQPEAKVYHKNPETLHELINLFVKSSVGRVAFSKKYPKAPDILLLNFHFPLIYAAALLILLFYQNITAFALTLLPALIYFLSGSIISFIESKNLILSFFVKPFLDIASIGVIYVSYHYNKLVRR